jgi:hypothetical protein
MNKELCYFGTVYYNKIEAKDEPFRKLLTDRELYC